MKWIKSINPDIIHVHTPATIGHLGITTAKLLSKPLIASYHTLMEEYFKIYIIPKRVNLVKKFIETISQNS